jgi:quercetin dioxygenase-like cupin family protein
VGACLATGFCIVETKGLLHVHPIPVHPTDGREIRDRCLVSCGSFCHRSIPSRDAHDAGGNPASALASDQIGSSGLAGVHTQVVFGDPSKPGFYTILLFVPAHTTIRAHSHRDNRVATVVSGEWHLGYGNHFDAKSLKTLPRGSVYSEPGGDNHFARTDTDPSLWKICGYGPTDTHYFDAANDPRSREKK